MVRPWKWPDLVMRGSTRARADERVNPPWSAPHLRQDSPAPTWLPWARAAAGPAVFAAVSAVWMPRGPLTATQALSAMSFAALTGFAAGLLTRSRAAILAAPATFLAAVEPLRLRYSGPSVDGIHLGRTYGVMTLLLGRGDHGLFAVLPMAVAPA